MAKPLKELIHKINPNVVAAARLRADQAIFEIRLAKLREELSLSQIDLADRLGVSQPSIANMEKRGQEIKLSSLKRYIEAMGGQLTLDIKLPDGRHIGMSV
jgi:DNA-binding XRE family transcriptional regulator